MTKKPISFHITFDTYPLNPFFLPISPTADDDEEIPPLLLVTTDWPLLAPVVTTSGEDSAK